MLPLPGMLRGLTRAVLGLITVLETQNRRLQTDRHRVNRSTGEVSCTSLQYRVRNGYITVLTYCSSRTMVIIILYHKKSLPSLLGGDNTPDDLARFSTQCNPMSFVSTLLVKSSQAETPKLYDTREGRRGG